MGARKLSPEEVAQLGLDAEPAPPTAGLRKLSPDEVKALGLEGPSAPMLTADTAPSATKPVKFVEPFPVQQPAEQEGPYYTAAEKLMMKFMGPTVAEGIRSGKQQLANPQDDATKALAANIEFGKKFGRGSTMVSTSLVGAGVGGAIAKTLGPAVATVPGRIAVGSLAGAGGSAAGQAANDVAEGVPLREIPGRAKEAAAVGSVLGAAGGVVTEAANTTTGQAVIGWLRDKYGTLTRQLASRGADATHSVRAFGDGTKDANHVLGFIDRHPEVDKALGNPARVKDAVQAVIDESAPVTGPIYAKFDKVAGEMPVKDVVALIDKEIQPLKKAGKEPFREALEDLKANVLREAKEVGTKTWTHARLREWVTDAAATADKKYGSLAGTTGWEIADKVHDVADDILKSRLKVAAMINDELAADLPTLRAANTDISAGIKLRQLAENAQQRASYAPPGRGWDKAAATAAALALGAGGGPSAIGAAALVKGAQAATSLPVRREVTRAVAELARAAANGKQVSQAAAAAAASGVPQALIDKVLKNRQSPEIEE